MLACYAIHDMLEAAGEKALPVIPQLIVPIKKALTTKNTAVIAATLRVIQHLCSCGEYQAARTSCYNTTSPFARNMTQMASERNISPRCRDVPELLRSLALLIVFVECLQLLALNLSAHGAKANGIPFTGEVFVDANVCLAFHSSVRWGRFGSVSPPHPSGLEHFQEPQRAQAGQHRLQPSRPSERCHRPNSDDARASWRNKCLHQHQVFHSHI